MSKVDFKPSPALMPLPATMVSAVAEGYKPNIITISWIGVVCSEPPMLSISVTPQRHSYDIIKKSGEFVVNVTSQTNLKETDFCGTKSGRDYDKFETLGLTALPGKVVKAPLIEECPINLECQTRQSIMLGSHEMFIAEIVAVHVSEEFVKSNGRIDIEKLKPLVYCTQAREYWGNLSSLLGKYGTGGKEAKK